jgi:radical SAM superfamily enzyme YgiQ (UPF0313 family)
MIKPKILILYPNIPLMMTPGIAVGLFTSICKKESCDVELFETTGYFDTSSKDQVHLVRSSTGGTRSFSYENLDIEIKKEKNMIPDFIQMVESYKPDLILVTVVEDSFLQAVRLLNSIKSLKIPNIVGGIFPTSQPDLCMSYDCINMIGIHEGENTLKELISRIKNKENFENIKGTWVRLSDGSIQKNLPQPLVNICDITPDFSLFNENRFYRPYGGKIFKAIPMETYRGCPYHCTYCNSPTTRDFGKSFGLSNFLRKKSINKIKEELILYKELYNPTFITFMDDSFLARPKSEIFAFCEMYEKHCGLPFWMNTRIENCKPDILKAIKQAGCYRMQFGLESGNEEYRKTVLKRTVPNKVYYEFFDYINDSDIAYGLNVIIGMPFETREFVFDTINMVKKAAGYDGTMISTFIPYSGTDLKKICIENGFIDKNFINDDPKGLSSFSSLNMPNPYLQREEIDALSKTFNLYCYFPETEWENIKKAETDGSLRDYYYKIYNKNFFFSDVQLGGKTRIEGSLACRTDEASQWVI